MYCTNSDLPTNQTFHQFHDLYTELDLHRIMSGFHGAFATGVASQQGTLTLPDTWFRPPFWDLLMLQLLRPNSSNLPCLYSTFHLEYPLVLSRFYIVQTVRKHLHWLNSNICRCYLIVSININDQKHQSEPTWCRMIQFSFSLMDTSNSLPPKQLNTINKTNKQTTLQ